MAQRSPIRSFLSVVPSNAEVGKQSQGLPERPSSGKSAGKTIQFPELGSAKRSHSSVTRSSGRNSGKVNLPPTIPNPSSARSNLLLDPRISAPISADRPPQPPLSKGGQGGVDRDRASKVGQGSVTLASFKEDLKHPPEPLRASPRMPSPQSRSAPAPTTSSKSSSKSSSQSQNSQSVTGPARSTSNTSSQKSRQPAVNRRKSRNVRDRRPRQMSPLLSCLRLLILGVGLAAIGGTLLSIRNPSPENTAQMQTSVSGAGRGSRTPGSSGNLRLNSAMVLPLGQEITELKNEIQSLTASYSQMTPGVFFVDLDNGAYLDINASNTFSAASTIKVPILIALFQAVDAGKIRLNEPLTMQSEYVAGGSGDMQYEAVGSEYTVLETARKMITISDNTATNMLIARLGGERVLNQRFQSWGLNSTKIQNFLPDIEGTNTTSPKDLVSLMAMVEKGGLLSLRSRDRVLEIMHATENNALLPQGLGNGATIAHKTGNIGSVLADMGMVDMPNGKRYLVSVMVKRPHDDPEAEEFIRQISQAGYQSFNGENGIAGNLSN